MPVYHPPAKPKKPASNPALAVSHAPNRPNVPKAPPPPPRFPSVPSPSPNIPTAAPPPKYPPVPTSTPAAPAPAASKPVVGSGFVPDSQYNTAIDDAAKAETQALTSIGDSERLTKNEFGFDDVTNPNSRVATLKKMFLANSGRALNQNAAAGQLYAGSTQNNQDYVRAGSERDTAATRAAYDRALGLLNDAKAAAKNATTNATRTAYEQWMARQTEAPGNVDETAGPVAATAAPPAVPGPLKGVARPAIAPPQKGTIRPPAPTAASNASRAAAFAKALAAAKKKGK